MTAQTFETVKTVRDTIAVITQGAPFNIDVMQNLPIWRNDEQRSAVSAVINVYGLDLKNGMAVIWEGGAA